MKIPPQYLPIMPYLVVPNATAFKSFMQTVFGATEQLLVPRTDNLIMHGELRIGNAVIMYADTTSEVSPRPAGMFLYIESVDETYAKAITAGAISTMAPVKQEYGYTAGFKDNFGNQWWIVEP